MRSLSAVCFSGAWLGAVLLFPGCPSKGVTDENGASSSSGSVGGGSSGQAGSSGQVGGSSHQVAGSSSTSTSGGASGDSGAGSSAAGSNGGSGASTTSGGASTSGTDVSGVSGSNGGSQAGSNGGAGSSAAATSGTGGTSSSGGGMTCPNLGDIFCGGNCVDPRMDPTYCGATSDCLGPNAGETCAGGKACLNGSCITTCTTGRVLCRDVASGLEACIDPNTSPQFCGARLDCSPANGNAGEHCPNGSTCSGGHCTNPCAGVNVDDNIACTADACDPITGDITHVPDNALCNDNNVCTSDVCNPTAGCEHPADPAAAPAQNPGDCHTQQCQGTVLANVIDNNDVPAPDGVACTVEECVNGVPGTRANDAACTDGNLCNGAERCVVGTGCMAALAPLNCSNVDACHVGGCNPTTGCTSTLLDADGDGHAPITSHGLACGGDDCRDDVFNAHPGAPELAGDGVDNDCDGFTDEGFGLLACPAAPVGKRILDTISLTAQVTGATAGTWSVRWTVEQEPQANSLALQGADTVTVTFAAVIRGNYILRAHLTQTGAAETTCPVAFSVAGPDEDFNAQLTMTDAVDVDLHVLHPAGWADYSGVNFSFPATNTFYNQFNWGPTYHTTDYVLGAYYNNPGYEAFRTIPDCHFNNCDACTVVVPGQPACTPAALAWDNNFSYPFGVAPTTANPKLDIDNRRGCYTDGFGNRVCTPENISIRTPGPSTGQYTIAVHYWGEPVTELAGTYYGNRRGFAPPGLGTVSVDVEVYCKGVLPSPFKKFHCADIPVDGWCFVATAQWNGASCSAITAVPDVYGTGGTGSFPYALVDMTTQPVPNYVSPPLWDNTPGYGNVVATPVP